MKMNYQDSVRFNAVFFRVAMERLDPVVYLAMIDEARSRIGIEILLPVKAPIKDPKPPPTEDQLQARACYAVGAFLNDMGKWIHGKWLRRMLMCGFCGHEHDVAKTGGKVCFFPIAPYQLCRCSEKVEANRQVEATARWPS